ncbi:hypothetical protein Rhopal_005387-T1 [Rhodotorula paludigena]|uniref:Uncharacterized protein n=1 Tax=Rhodotorula paludigena TaxID=86838 RepID=A0AAV5GS90_9BASI|nr:hypothetical protein Rhopal_005387-T1 [Rhodotorula paludigena]
MSSRGSPIPKDLADPPANPFQPVLPAPGTANRRPIVRRALASDPGRPVPAPKPFGEIGKEDDDKFDTASVLSAGWTDTGEPLDDEMVKFLPRVRDLRYRRPIVRKKVDDTEVEKGRPPGEGPAADEEQPAEERMLAKKQQEAADGTESENHPVATNAPGSLGHPASAATTLANAALLSSDP